MESNQNSTRGKYLPLMEEYKHSQEQTGNPVFTPHPFCSAGLFSKFFFNWTSPVVSYGKKNRFSPDNMGQIFKGLDVQTQEKRLERNWNECKGGKGFTLLKALARTYKGEFTFAFFINFLVVCCEISIPFLISLIVKFMQNENESIWLGVGLIVAYILASLLSHILEEQATFLQNILGDKAFSSMIALVYNKTLRISPATNKDFSQGEIINFIQVDSEKLWEIAFEFPPIARLPIQLIFSMTFLFYHFTYYLFVPIGISVLMIFANYFLAKWMARIEASVLEKKDKRMNIVTEVMNNIKIIKLNSWVKYFIDKVTVQRNKELWYLKKGLAVNSWEMFVNWLMSPILIISAFSTYFLCGNTMSLANGFACLQIFYSIDKPIRWIPSFMGTFMDFTVSMKRIQKFLLWEEINPKLIEFASEQAAYNDVGILIENANFSWGGKKDDIDSEETKDISGNKKSQLKVGDGNHALNGQNSVQRKVYSINEDNNNEDDIEANKNTESSLGSDSSESDVKFENSIQVKDLSLKIFKGEFICVIGEVGSGKSSLLNAILGDMIYLNDGLIDEFKTKVMNADTRKELSQASMQFEGTVKLGGSVSYVQQVPWIQNKTIRDNILFGESLDEQKYNKVVEVCQLVSDLEMLPGGDLTEIGEKGINLSGGQKARVSLARAVYADKDIVLMDDPISALDSNVKKKIFEEVLLGEMKYKTRVLVTHAVDFIDRVDRIIVMEDGKIKHFGTYEELQHSDEIKHVIETLSHVHHGMKAEEDKENIKDPQEVLEDHGKDEKNFISDEGTKITDEENDEQIEVGWDVYASFFLSKGTFIVYILLVPLFIAYSYLIVYNSIHIGEWVENSETQFWHYLVLVILHPIGYTAVMITIFLMINFTTVRISRILHESMLEKTCNAPINLYFDKTPSGRILNRFSKDINKMDDNIGHKVTWWLEWYIWALFSIYIAVLNSPWVLLIVPVVLGLWVWLIRYYIKTFRDLKRLESVTFSPIITHLSETLSGATTIRTFNNREAFIEQNYKTINQNLNVAFWINAVRRWFAVRLELIWVLIIIFTSAFLLYFRDKVDPILIGVLFTHTIWLGTEFLWGSQLFSEIEGNLVAYDRCLKILSIPQEASKRVPIFDSSEWLRQATVQFKNFYLKYRPDTELVLKDLSFTIGHKEKIGVVGRTGAGKSTLCLALCRIVEAHSGAIFIDGVDISKIGLDQLREKITIIPQDPTLFNGTLRFNLDPKNIYSDEELLELTSQAALDKLIARDEKGLDQMIEEHGQNLSSGEKQLLCIWRAILKKNKVVLMDEATANIDIKTEQIIQKLIKEKFEDATVITIAHRLNTIINSDRVLVLSKGEVEEYDCPKRLLQDPNSTFYSYVKWLQQKEEN